MKKYIIYTAIATTFLGCNQTNNFAKHDAVKIDTDYLKELEYEKSTTYNGFIESPKVIQIKNRIDGFLEKQYYKDGSFVKKGDLLFKIDNKQYLNDLDYAKSQLKTSELEMENLKNIYLKSESSFRIGGLSKQEYETAKSNFEKSKSGIDTLKVNIEKLKLNLSYTNIYSPINGFAEKSQQNEGTYLNLSTPYLTNIYATDKLYFAVMIPYQNKVIDANIEINNQKYDGKLSFCDPMTDSSGLTKCRYEFKPKTKIEINALGKIYLKEKATGLFIDQRALIQGKKGKSVYIVKNNRAIETEIKTGIWNGGDIEILDGLNIKDKIIVNGISNVNNNSVVGK